MYQNEYMKIDIKWVFFLMLLSGLITFYVTINSTSEVDIKPYEKKSEKYKYRYDSLLFVYSRDIDSLNSVVASSDTIINDISKRLSQRKKQDNENYKSFMRSNGDSSFAIISNYLDSIHPKFDSISIYRDTSKRNSLRY